MTTASAIIPAYNADRYIRQCLESVRGQTRPPDQIVVVDDGSTDRTLDSVRSFGARVEIIRLSHAGIPATRNAGLRRATGTFIAFLDADDMWQPEKLEIQLDVLAKTGAEIAVGRMQMIHDDGATLRPLLYPWHGYYLGASLIHRDVFDRIGVFDESQPTAEDLDWFLRAKESGASMVMHDDIVLHYRRHNSNISSDREARYRFVAMALKKSIDRRR